MAKPDPAVLGLAAERFQRVQTGHIPSRIRDCGAVLRPQTSLKPHGSASLACSPSHSRAAQPIAQPLLGNPSDCGNLALHIWALLSLKALGRPQILEPDFRWKTGKFWDPLGGFFDAHVQLTRARLFVVYSCV